MKIFRRAFRNVRRMVGRSMLMGGILIVISALIMVGLSIQASSAKSIKDARSNLGNTVTLQRNISGNRANFQRPSTSGGSTETQTMPEIAEITKADAVKYSAISYVQGYNIVTSSQSNASITAVQPDSGSSATATPTASGTTATATNSATATPKPTATPNQNQGGFDIQGGGGVRIQFKMADFMLSGNSNTQLSTDFYKGTKKLVSGRFFTADEINKGSYVVMIDQNLATLNDLKVGSTFKLINPQNDEDTGTTVTVIGIYKDSVEPDLSAMATSMISSNTIYMPYTTVTAYNTKLASDTDTSEKFGRRIERLAGIQSVVYYIDDPSNIEAFQAQAEKLGLDTTKFKMDANDSAYSYMVKPLQNLSKFANAMVWAVVITGAAVMILLMSMISRERKGEVGIMRALGQKRRTIGAQFAVEAFTVCIIALMIGTVIGGALSNYTANKLLSNQVASVEQQQSDNNNQSMQQFGGGPNMRIGTGGTFGGFGRQSTENVKMIETIQTDIGFAQILKVLVAGLAICFAGALVSTYWVMKYEPMQILSNRT